MRGFLGEELTKKGLSLKLGTNLTSIEALPQGEGATGKHGRRLTLSTGETLDVDLVLTAVGRIPNTKGLGLEAIGVKLGARGGVEVDDDYRSSVPNIFAVGDVLDRVQLTPVALAEGTLVARTLFDQGKDTLSYENIATAVFSQPNVATVGLTDSKEWCIICMYHPT